MFFWVDKIVEIKVMCGNKIIIIFEFFNLFLFSDQINIKLKAKIKSIEDKDNILNGIISPGNLIDGEYSYNTKINDSNYTDTVASYHFKTSPNGIILKFKNFIFILKVLKHKVMYAQIPFSCRLPYLSKKVLRRQPGVDHPD